MALRAHKQIFCAWLQFGDGMRQGEKVDVLNDAPVEGGKGVVEKAVTGMEMIYSHGKCAAENYTGDRRPDLIGGPWVG